MHHLEVIIIFLPHSGAICEIICLFTWQQISNLNTTEQERFQRGAEGQKIN